jgi:putative Holliday junction resolvase
MDGSEQTVSRRARRFGDQLLGRFQLPVHLVDERLTTREARDRLAAEGRAGSDDHPVAAQIILESWLNEQKPSQ